MQSRGLIVLLEPLPGRLVPVWAGLVVFSLAVTLLSLTGSLYLIEIYDRVLPARSAPTLVAFTLLAGGLYLAHGLLDFCRGRLATRAGEALAAGLRQRGSGRDRPQAEIDQVFEFFAGAAFVALLDALWVPVFVAAGFLMHPLVGAYVLAAAVGLGLLGLLMARRAGSQERIAAVAGARRDREQQHLSGARVTAHEIRAAARAAALEDAARAFEAARLAARDRAQGAGALLRAARLFVHGGLIALGAWLVLDEAMTGGMMMAATLILARTLQPVEVVAAQGTRIASFGALLGRLAIEADETSEIMRPAALLGVAPSRTLDVENVALAGVVRGVSFTLRAGDGLGLVGPSGAGKSLLARAIAGHALRPELTSGVIRLDGASYALWGADALAQHIGYLPHEPRFLPGTIAEAISRFAPDCEGAHVLAAAEAAGLHETIMRLPAGYATRIGEDGGAMLSRGDVQRLGLARALYGDPFVVVLDEPAAYLDGAGETALTRAIERVRERGGIVIVVAHRASGLAGVDRVLALGHGRVLGFGPKDEVLRRLVDPRAARMPMPASGLRIVGDPTGGGGP